MSLLIGRYEFEGPLVNWRGVRRQPGIYAIMSFANQEYELVEVAQANDLQSVFQDEQKQEFWQNKATGMLTFAVHYSPRVTRKKREEMVCSILREFDGEYRIFELREGLVASGCR